MAKKFDWSAPLYCNPYIAVAVGAEAGIVYERLRWMIQDSKGKKTAFGSIRKDGRRWVDFTYAQLLEWLPIFKSTKALRDVITKLEKAGLIDSETFPSGKWYTVSNLDPATLTKIVTPETDEICQGDDENRQSRVTKNDTPPDENRQPLIYMESESTSESTSEAVADSFSSTAPPATPPAIEEKEIVPDSPVSGLDQRLLDVFAKLVGVYGGSSEQTKAELAGGLRTILKDYPDAQPSHFRHFNEYHQEQNQNRKTGPRYALPTINYVVGGWGQFMQWWESHRNASQWGFIPGTDHYLGMARWEWDELSDMESGAMIQIRGQWVYRKQADGAFTEVPCEQWPDEWKRESA
ncbi:MAG: hypothetical protein K8L91_07170 [Anaerolineae bacterium]|nr:hypothetical protein [Anaerolineae bacterium]